MKSPSIEYRTGRLVNFTDFDDFPDLANCDAADGAQPVAVSAISAAWPRDTPSGRIGELPGALDEFTSICENSAASSKNL